jgi:hypothetical protein
VLRLLAEAMLEGAERDRPPIVRLLLHSGTALASLWAGHSNMSGFDGMVDAVNAARLIVEPREKAAITDGRLALHEVS